MEAQKKYCLRKAMKRFLENFHWEHPFLQVINTPDGLNSTASNNRMFEEGKLRCILGAKPGDRPFLFLQPESSEDSI